MKRKTLLILAVLLTAIACLFTSCSASVEPPKEEEGLAYVTFGNGGSRSLSTEYGIKSYGELFWFYTAVKQDGFGLTGQSPKEGDRFIPQPVKPVKDSAGQLTDINRGIDGTVGPLSQGAWVFTLYAYEQKNGTQGVNLVYQGESATIVLKGNETRAVPVSVELKGDYGVVDLSQAYFKWAESATSGDGQVYITVTLNGKTDSSVSVNATSLIGPLSKNAENKYPFSSPLSITGYETGKIPAGYYTCTVNAYFESDLSSSSISSTASPKATQIFGLRVYGNAITYIKGDITEDVFTDVEFTVPEQKMVAFNSSEAVVAANPAGETDSYGTPLNTTVNFGTTNLDSAATHVLTVEVTDLVTSTSKFVVTDDSARTSVAGLSFTLNSIKTVDGVTVQNEVTEFSSNDPVIVTTYVAKGLTNVGIKYNGTETADQKSPEFISYNASNGELKFKAYHFSEYYAIANCFDALNETTNYAYTNFADAVSNAGDGNKIVLYRNVIVDSAVVVDKGLTIDLNGYSIKGNKTRALQFAIGTSEIIGSGIISSEKNDVDSSVIKVGGDTTNSVALSIGSDVIIDAKTSYGITVFGATSEILTVNGTIKSSAPENESYDGCAVSTLGTDTTASTIIINEGAELTAINTNAIYMPSGNLTVNGGIITGTTGIYVKSGRTEVKGGTITGNGPQNDYNYYGNGGKSTGEALVVDSCGYPNGKPELSVTDGTFISKNANAVGSYKTTGNVLVKEFISGGTFSSDPATYVDSLHYSEAVGNIWEIKKVFEIGSGTSGDPYIILTADQFYKIADNYNACYKLENDIIVDQVSWFRDNSPATSNGGSGYAVLPYLENVTIDGNGHTIINSKNYYMFGMMTNSTIQNTTFLCNGHNLTYMGTDVNFSNVTVEGNIQFDWNDGALVTYLYGGTNNFTNCINKAKLTGNYYSSVFVGYVIDSSYDAVVNFTNCDNYGEIVAGYASLFIANPHYAKLTLNIENCYNKGLVHSVNDDEIFSPLTSVTWDGSPTNWKITINDNSLTTWKDASWVTFGGNYLKGPKDSNLKVVVNDDNTLTITPANNDKVDHYVVAFDAYCSIVGGGSLKAIVSEELENTLTSTIRVLPYVDKTWVDNNNAATEGSINGYTTYTLGEETYYLLPVGEEDLDMYSTNGQPLDITSIYVMAYDSYNTLLAIAFSE